MTPDDIAHEIAEALERAAPNGAAYGEDERAVISDTLRSLHATATGKPKRSLAAARDWQCMECGKRLTLRQAERAMYGATGCPKCGSSDIDLGER